MKYPRIICSLLSFLAFTTPVLAQTHISSQVITAEGRPLAYVSVVLLHDTSFVAGTVTDEEGRFSIAVDTAQGPFSLRFSLIGFDNLSISMDARHLLPTRITMTPAGKALDEVVVTSRKPLITRKADRYIVNIENSNLATAHSALEVLQKSPGLWVTPDGSIRIMGSQSVTVMINDVVQRMSGADLAEYLRTLRSEDISRIEIIPNPPSEFEASATGGIVHIILKKARQQGLTGSTSLQYRQQGVDPFLGGGVSIDLKLPKTYWFGNVSAGMDNSRYTGYSNVTYPDQTQIFDDTKRFNHNKRILFRVGAAWDIHQDQSLTLQVLGNRTHLDQQFNSDILYNLLSTEVTGVANSHWLRNPWQGSATANYNWKIDSMGSSLKLLADYTLADKQENNHLMSTYSDTVRNRETDTHTPSTTHIATMQADYTKALPRQVFLKTGVKYVSTVRHNTVLTQEHTPAGWEKDSAGSNEFAYNERLLMFYGSWERTMKNTSLRAGLRGEMTWSEGHSLTSNESIRKDYFSLFPSVFFNHTFNENKGNSFHFSYSRRVKRPGFNDLNPYRLQVHDFTILVGNPDLVPQYTHSLQAGYVLHQKFTADLYYNSIHNFMAQTAHTVDSNIIEYQSRNFRNSTEYGLNLSSDFTFGKVFELRASASFNHAHTGFDSVDIKQFYYMMQVSPSVSFKNLFDADLNIYYNSAYYLSEASRQVAVWSTYIGITRRIMHGKGRLRLFANDLFNKEQEKQITQYAHTRIDFYQKRPTRIIGISFNWNFKSGKTFSRRKIESDNSDEKNRL